MVLFGLLLWGDGLAQEGTLVISEVGRPKAICPQKLVEPTERRIASLVFETIYRHNSNNILEGIHGQTLGMSDDGKSCELQVRSDAAWGDVVDFTLEDYRFSLACHLELNPIRRSGTLSLIGVEAHETDRLTLLFSTAQNEESVKGILAQIPLIPAQDYEGRCDGNYDPALCTKPRGSSWYFIEGEGIVRTGTGSVSLGLNVLPEQRAIPFDPEAEPVADPVFDRVQFKYNQNASGALQELIKGDADFMADIPTSEWPKIMSNPEIFGERLKRPRNWSLIINHRNPALKSKAFREGLAHALNRVEIFQHLFSEDDSLLIKQKVLSGPFASTNWLACKDCEPRRHEPELARSKFEEDPSVWSAFRNSGAELRLWYPGIRANNFNIVPSKIRSELAAYGINIEPDRKNKQRYLQDLAEKPDDWDLALVEWEESHVGVHISRLFGPSYYEDTLNVGDYYSPTLEGLIEDILSATNRNDLQKFCIQAHRIIHRDVPHLFLFQVETLCATRGNLVAKKIHPGNYLGHLDTWYLK